MYVGFNCKKRKGGKKMSVNYVHKEEAGVRRVMEKKNILDFHFDYLNLSLTHSVTKSGGAEFEFFLDVLASLDSKL